MVIEEKCYVNDCQNNPKYIIEWYSLDQYGKKPLIADERACCDNFEHLIQLSYHNNYGGVPDGIVDFDNIEKENLILFEKVINAMKK